VQQYPEWLLNTVAARQPKNFTLRWQVGNVVEANDSISFTLSNSSIISSNFTRRWQVGAAVEARYSNGDWYRATIVAVHVAGNTDTDLRDKFSRGRGRSKKVRGSREGGRSMEVLSLSPRERMLSMKNSEFMYELAWEDGDARETLKSGSDIRESLKSAHAIRAGGACAQEDEGCQRVSVCSLLTQWEHSLECPTKGIT
jgi:hypothetical protein